MESVTAVLLCLAAAAAGSPVQDEFIINGRIAEWGQLPWNGRLYPIGCSASVVNSRTILTAAHCVCQTRPTHVELGMIEANKSQGRKYRISETRIFPGYPQGSGCAVVRAYDLAILKTATNIQYGRSVLPIPLWLDSEPPVGSRIISMGFGADGRGGKDVLRYAATQLASGCRSDFFCSRTQPNSVSFGDSGGPMIYEAGGKYYQLGVNAAVSQRYSLYVRLPEYKDWVRRNLA